MAKLDKPTRAGLTLCALPVAVFSGYSQFETARMALIPVQLAWVLFVATDAAAFVSTRVWLDEKYGKGIRRYAASIVIFCVLLSVIGAALHLGLSVPEGQPPRPVPNWLPYAVGGIPSLVLAALIHLGALIGAAPEKSVKSTKMASEKPAKATRATTSRPEAGSLNVGTAEHVRPPTSAVPASSATAEPPSEPAPTNASAPAPEVGKGSTRDQMLAYLDEINGDTNGAELDRKFGTRNYGRGVLRAWKKHHPMASGE